MPDLLFVDHAQDVGAAVVSGGVELVDHARGDVQPARLQHHRHDGEPAHQVVGGGRGGLPQAVVRRQVAVGGVELGQPVGEHEEMPRLVVADRDPVVEKGGGQAGAAEARDDVEGEVDRVQLDMRDGVQQRDASGDVGPDPAARHGARRLEFRPRRSGRPVRRVAAADGLDLARQPARGRVAGRLCLRARVGRLQNGDGGRAEVRRRRRARFVRYRAGTVVPTVDRESVSAPQHGLRPRPGRRRARRARPWRSRVRPRHAPAP